MPRKQWNEELSKIEVEGGTHDDKVVFYTALYHILIHPNILQDVNGQYPVMESDRIKTGKGRSLYGVFVMGYLSECPSVSFSCISGETDGNGQYDDRHV